MISPSYAQQMALYNRWQNQSLFGAADRLPDAERKRARGAFFESVHGTLSHILFGDQMWLHRFTGTTPQPIAKSIAESTGAYPDWDELRAARAVFDEVIIAWAGGLTAADLEGDLAWYSGSQGRTISNPRWLLVTHMFNHQTHHRGQVHCLLTQNGLRLDATDIPFGP